MPLMVSLAAASVDDVSASGSTALVCSLTIAAVAIAAAMLLRSKPASDGEGGVSYEDLVDPAIRADHLSFNEGLHQRFNGQQVLSVRGEPGCHIAYSYSMAKQILNDHSHFSSNPFPDGRLVALNTMEKADHARVLRFVHSHYRQEDIASLEGRVQQIIEQCTDDLEREGCDVVMWAKRIHMAGSLARLGVDFTKQKSDGALDWAKVDEIIALNDAMVALVAPLGGIGRRHAELPLGQSLRLLLGLLVSIPSTLAMVARLGVRCTWSIIRPDVTVFFPPKHPRTGLWWRPELIQLVPQYFLALHDLLMSDVDGGPLPSMRKGVESGDLELAEALTLMVQLMVNMTTANALGSMVYRLSKEQEAAKAVAGDVEKLGPAFVQEVLRLDAPLQRNPRRVLKRPESAKYAGCPFKQGDQVLVFLGAANMDPAFFEEPAKFRLDREGKDKGTPLSFGTGMHYCLGSNLVKLEMQTALEVLLRRFDRLELVEGGEERLTDIDVGNYGFTKLKVRLQRKPSANA